MEDGDFKIKYKQQDDINKNQKKSRFNINKNGALLGVLFIIAGIIWMAYVLGLIPNLLLTIWPQLAIIIIGLFILVQSL